MVGGPFRKAGTALPPPCLWSLWTPPGRDSVPMKGCKWVEREALGCKWVEREVLARGDRHPHSTLEMLMGVPQGGGGEGSGSE